MSKIKCIILQNSQTIKNTKIMKKKEVLQYFVSIILGTIIGLGLCKYFQSSLLLGVTAGAIIGFVICAFEQIVRLIKNAFIKTHKSIKDFEFTLKRRAMYLFLGIFLFFAAVTYFAAMFLHSNYPSTMVTVGLTADIIIGLVFGIFGYVVVKGETSELKGGKVVTEKKKKDLYRVAIFGGIFLNPFLLIITIVIALSVAVWECRFKIKEYWEPKIAFVKSGLVWVHSKFRFTAMIWIAVGIVAGYLYGGDQMIMYGTATGLLLGTVDYFLVAVRWLKLKPSL